MNGFYDSMGSEQAKEFQGMLEMVTSSMDNISKSMYNTGIDFGSYNAGGKYKNIVLFEEFIEIL